MRPDQDFGRLNIEEGSSDDILEFSIDADSSIISESIKKFFIGMAERHKDVAEEKQMLTLHLTFAEYFQMKESDQENHFYRKI